MLRGMPKPVPGCPWCKELKHECEICCAEAAVNNKEFPEPNAVNDLIKSCCICGHKAANHSGVVGKKCHYSGYACGCKGYKPVGKILKNRNKAAKNP